MNATTKFQLMRKAVVLFPRTAYTSDSSVRHACRGWVASRLTLGSKWILVKEIVRLQ